MTSHFGIDFDMKKPVIVFDKSDGTVHIFESAQVAERYLEPIDVQTGELTFYSSDGGVLDGSIFKDQHGIERVAVSAEFSSKSDPSGLRRILMDELEYYGHERSILEQMDLDSLVYEALKYKTE